MITVNGKPFVAGSFPNGETDFDKLTEQLRYNWNNGKADGCVDVMLDFATRSIGE